jgi:L-alanine-DL-glutamate epimerase-like enolase superfamily enzyme
MTVAMPDPRARAVRIREVRLHCQEHHYRTPIKFGGVALDRATILDVECVVETRAGKTAQGFGSMPLGNVWSFPSRLLRYEQTLAAMQALAERIAAITTAYLEFGHSIDINHALEPAYLQAAIEVAREQGLPEPIPKLCTLVVASAFDAAIHDAYGKVHGLNCYHTYGPEFLSHDLGHYLSGDFTGLRLDAFLRREPAAQLPLYHLVGALDPLIPQDVKQPVGDGLPEQLAEWIRFNGLTHLKIKLNGDNLDWDVERVCGVDAVAAATKPHEAWRYSLDFNERCPHVDYLLEVLGRVREQSSTAFDRIQYIEQPTARDLKAHPNNRMHAAAELRPIVIDESLTDLESLFLAREQGYTGVALKACKGQSASLLMAAAAQRFGMFLCVQDLTCPGASLIHSAGLAAHIPGVAAIEANARQYVPAANAAWEVSHPGIFLVTDGCLKTGSLTGKGLSAVP